MKKKNIFVGIGCLIVMSMAINFNVSHSNHNSDISLLSIKAMTNAAAECTGTVLEGYFCYGYDNGSELCTYGGEVGTYCP